MFPICTFEILRFRNVKRNRLERNASTNARKFEPRISFSESLGTIRIAVNLSLLERMKPFGTKQRRSEFLVSRKKIKNSFHRTISAQCTFAMEELRIDFHLTFYPYFWSRYALVRNLFFNSAPYARQSLERYVRAATDVGFFHINHFHGVAVLLKGNVVNASDALTISYRKEGSKISFPPQNLNRIRATSRNAKRLNIIGRLKRNDERLKSTSIIFANKKLFKWS